jgi:hypothetical protein
MLFFQSGEQHTGAFLTADVEYYGVRTIFGIWYFHCAKYIICSTLLGVCCSLVLPTHVFLGKSCHKVLTILKQNKQHLLTLSYFARFLQATISLIPGTFSRWLWILNIEFGAFLFLFPCHLSKVNLFLFSNGLSS